MREVSRFVIGDVLQKSLSIYVRNLPAVASLAVVLAVPGGDRVGGRGGCPVAIGRWPFGYLA